MKEHSKKNEPQQFLSGWKEIANYLGKGVRTVQRYEREFGLPVRRPAGRPWGSVVATRAELDAWVYASPIRHEFRLSRPGPDEKYVAVSVNIQRGLEHMKQLRDQMSELRAEVNRSVSLLRDSVFALQSNSSVWRDARREHLIDQREFDLLTAPSKHPKAS